jgi:hypothetical protein
VRVLAERRDELEESTRESIRAAFERAPTPGQLALLTRQILSPATTHWMGPVARSEIVDALVRHRNEIAHSQKMDADATPLVRLLAELVERLEPFLGETLVHVCGLAPLTKSTPAPEPIPIPLELRGSRPSRVLYRPRAGIPGHVDDIRGNALLGASRIYVVAGCRELPLEPLVLPGRSAWDVQMLMFIAHGRLHYLSPATRVADSIDDAEKVAAVRRALFLE